MAIYLENCKKIKNFHLWIICNTLFSSKKQYHYVKFKYPRSVLTSMIGLIEQSVDIYNSKTKTAVECEIISH